MAARGSGLRKRTILAALVVGMLAGTPPVSALEAKGFALTKDKTKVSKNFPAIPGEDPFAPVQAQDIRTLENCRANTTNYAVAVEITMAQEKENGHETTFDLTWPGMEDFESDLDMYIFNEDGELIALSAQTGGPETATITDLPNGPVFVCVWNFDGNNSGYTLTGTVRFLALPSFGTDPTPSPTPIPPQTPKPIVTPRPPTASAEPTVAPEDVATPGPDGPTDERGLPVVAAGRQADELDDGTSVTTIVFTVLTILIVVGGGTLVALRIRRDRT